MIHLVELFLYGLFGAVIWRLRGGALAEILNSNLGGTTVDRIVTSIIFPLPLALINPVFASISAIGIFIGLIVTGWGPFQGMGLPSVTPPEQSWLDWLPTKLGLKVQGYLYCAVGMLECGFVFVAPMILILLLAGFGVNVLTLLAMSPLFVIAYSLPRVINFPSIPKFATGQEWGEIFVGFFLALILLTIL
jgi:hypothetical protein